MDTGHFHFSLTLSLSLSLFFFFFIFFFLFSFHFLSCFSSFSLTPSIHSASSPFFVRVFLFFVSLRLILSPHPLLLLLLLFLLPAVGVCEVRKALQCSAVLQSEFNGSAGLGVYMCVCVSFQDAM